MDTTEIKAHTITILRDMAPELRARGVAQLSVFGSFQRGEAGPDSDVDLLLDLRPGHHISLIDRLILRDRIADAIGRRVDLIPRAGLIEDIREVVERDAEPVLP